MAVEFSGNEIPLLDVLLTKEAAELKIEIHHTRNRDYREFLKDREKQILSMLSRVKEHEPLPLKIYV